MPPKQSTAGASRGRPPGSKNKAAAPAKGKQRAQPNESPEPRHREDPEEVMEVDEELEDDEDDEEPEKTIPPELLTRILHEFFEKEGTRITKDANNAVAKYMDIFVKEAIARAAAEREGGFLEVRLRTHRATRVSKARELTWARATYRLRISRRLRRSSYSICDRFTTSAHTYCGSLAGS